MRIQILIITPARDKPEIISGKNDEISNFHDFQIMASQWLMDQNTSELVRLKALDPYFTNLQPPSNYVSCKNAKRESRAIKRTKSDVFWSKSRWDTVSRSLCIFCVFPLFAVHKWYEWVVLVAKNQENFVFSWFFHCTHLNYPKSHQKIIYYRFLGQRAIKNGRWWKNA